MITHSRTAPPVDQQSNKLGAVRLCLAALVLVSHSSELVDGNRGRELLTMFGRSLSFGELGVDGFFVLSGYLVSQSVVRSRNATAYLRKRVLRIVPAYAVAYLLMFLLARFVGGRLQDVDPVQAVVGLLLLLQPEVPGVFPGLPCPLLNGSMWTVAHEFRCYGLVLVLGLCGILARPVFFACLLAFASAVLLLHPVLPLPAHLTAVTGTIAESSRLIPVFLIGVAFWVLRDWLPPFTPGRALIATALAVASLFSWRAADLGVSAFGGYAMLWYATASRPNLLNRIGRRHDISYGVYLYGWPVQSVLVWTVPGISPVLVFVFTIPVVAALGWLSWTLIEAPALRFKERERVPAAA